MLAHAIKNTALSGKTAQAVMKSNEITGNSEQGIACDHVEDLDKQVGGRVGDEPCAGEEHRLQDKKLTGRVVMG